ncbi:MAG TPA: GYF domain-containing protein [Chthoniobacterales bacterium]|nr:GYF domain-containing protein [Chthoniobacterales bacterium]
MQIYVGKNGQQLGPFSIEEINRKLADGTFSGSDLAWYEGAANWAPLSGVPGVVLAPTGATPTPSPTPAPAPTPTAAVSPAASAPIRPNTAIVQPPRSNYKTLAVVSWILLGITFVVSMIPLIGCGTWFLVWPVAAAAIVMGILILVRGGTIQGILVILGGVLIVPLCFLGQFLSLAIFGDTGQRNEQTQIMENLRRIDGAKIKWVAETKAETGAPVTMANLTSQLGGKEVKAVVGEQYDPMPVGQAPTAKLPATKALGTFAAGEVLTAASIEKALANSSTFSFSLGKTSPAPSVAPLTSPTPPAVSPSVSPSARPSASPRPSGSPRSLISPRQAPDESPATGPSPSAKFAPRTGPRQTPPPSQNEPDSENSGAPKQGRQFPRESPSESPEEKPDDDNSDG